MNKKYSNISNKKKVIYIQMSTLLNTFFAPPFLKFNEKNVSFLSPVQEYVITSSEKKIILICCKSYGLHNASVYCFALRLQWQCYLNNFIVFISLHVSNLSPTSFDLMIDQDNCMRTKDLHCELHNILVFPWETEKINK